MHFNQNQQDRNKSKKRKRSKKRRNPPQMMQPPTQPDKALHELTLPRYQKPSLFFPEPLPPINSNRVSMESLLGGSQMSRMPTPDGAAKPSSGKAPRIVSAGQILTVSPLAKTPKPKTPTSHHNNKPVVIDNPQEQPVECCSAIVNDHCYHPISASSSTINNNNNTQSYNISNAVNATYSSSSGGGGRTSTPLDPYNSYHNPAFPHQDPSASTSTANSQELIMEKRETRRERRLREKAEAAAKNGTNPTSLVSGPRTKKKKTLGQRVLKMIGLHHIMIILLMVIYVFIGGGIFYAIENEHENNNNLITRQEATDENNELVQNISEIVVANEASCGALSNATKELIRATIRDYQIQHEIGRTTKNWGYFGSVFYAATIITTIGYGNFAAQTSLGMGITMLYGLIGIPLFIVSLGSLGRHMAKLVGPLYNKIRGCCKRKNRSSVNSTKSGSNEPETPTIPVSVGLIICTVWMAICAAILVTWERNWTYFEAFYFLFITFTTIGLGDYTLSDAKEMLSVFPLTLFGLAFLAMSLNLLAEKFETVKRVSTDYVEDKLGIDIDTESEEE